MDEDYDEDNEKLQERIRLAQQANINAMIAGFVILAIGLAIAYFVWPSGMLDRTLSSITVGELLRAIAAGAVIVFFFMMAMLMWF